MVTLINCSLEQIHFLLSTVTAIFLKTTVRIVYVEPSFLPVFDLRCIQCHFVDMTLDTVHGRSGVKNVQNQRLYLQSSVKTFLPGFGNGRLKYCATV